jgi:acid phosphatase type 7
VYDDCAPQFFSLKNHVMKKSQLFIFICFASIGLFAKDLLAQIEHRPYPVYDTKPVIIQDPYLVDPSENAMTVVWLTDTPSHSKVLYGRADGDGELSKVAETQEHGMVPVGTRHAIRIEGLEPGVTYNYKVMSRRVVQLNPYWPEMGKWVESTTYSFTTFDRNKPVVSFSSITDTHEEVDRINTFMEMINWENTDFLIHTGDSFDWVNDEKHLFDRWLTPIAEGLKQKVPLIYARGNHELRGAFAREVFDYLPIHEGRFYFARDHGPLHLLVMDSGEDKPDTTNVYAGLNRLKEYREIHYEWFKNHVETSQSLKEASFRIVVMHDPRWGWVDNENKKWTETANQAGVDLVIAGHWHRYDQRAPGELDGNNYHVLVLNPNQIAHVEVDDEQISIEVRNTDDELVDIFRIDTEGSFTKEEL